MSLFKRYGRKYCRQTLAALPKLLYTVTAGVEDDAESFSSDDDMMLWPKGRALETNR